MTVVTKKKGDTNDKLFRKFSRLSGEDNIVFEVKRRMEFKRPLEIKKEKLRERHRIIKKAKNRY